MNANTGYKHDTDFNLCVSSQDFWFFVTVINYASSLNILDFLHHACYILQEEEHKLKNQVPIRITFNDSPRRGGRGGRRPRGGRGPRGTPGRGDRRGNPRDAAPRFDDEADFPSLVKSAA